MENGIEEQDSTKNLDIFIEARDGKKRNYIYDFGKALKCDHPSLKALSIGGTWYRCEKCNYALCIVSAYAQPLHSVVIGGILNALHFAKEFGGASLQEVLRRPIGQYDGTLQKPALPEGMDFSDAVAALEGIDVNAEDGGAAQLQTMLDEVWVAPKQRELHDTNMHAQLEQAGTDEKAEGYRKAIEANAILAKGQPEKVKALGERQADNDSGDPALPAG